MAVRSDETKPTPPRPERLLEIVRFLAAHSETVVLTEHARERMEERDILDVDLFRVLRTGRIVGRIAAGKAAGEWKCKVVSEIKGAREVGAVTVVQRERTLIVLTVEWEDA
jgi:hypothetical protein